MSDDGKFIVEYLMWGYQPHFQLYADTEAKGLFEKLDPALASKVFLVGFLDGEQKGRHPICVSPDDCAYQPAVFSGVVASAKYLESIDGSSLMIHDHPIAEENAEIGRNLRSLRMATEQAIQHATEYGKRVLTKCSWPAKVNGYWVILALQLDLKVYDNYYRLQKSHHQGFDAGVKTSLIDAIITEYLDAVYESLRKPDPGREFQSVADSENILRKSAKSLMYTPAAAGCNMQGLHGLFESCNTISTLKYEGKEGEGRIAFAKQNHPDIRIELSLVNPTPLRDYGAVRKLLEMTSSKFSLISDGEFVYGLGSILDTYQAAREDVFVVTFANQFSWALSHAGQVMMRVRYGMPELSQPDFPIEKFKELLKKVYKSISEADQEKLTSLARGIAAQKRGCMLVISASAEEEAKRLSNQCTQIKPFVLDDTQLKMFSSIDGATLVDLQGRCHAIGAILDGQAHELCNSARGSRYNSGIRL